MGQPTCFVQISFIKFATVSHTRRATGGRPRLAQAGDRGGQHQTRFCPVCANFQVGENLPPPWSPSDWLACRHWTNGRGEKCESKTPEPDGCIRHPTTFSVRYKTLARSELGENRGGSESQSPAWLGPHIRLAGPLPDKNCCRLQTVLHTSQDQSNELLHGKKGHKTAGIEPSWDCFTPGLCSCLPCSGQPSPDSPVLVISNCWSWGLSAQSSLWFQFVRIVSSHSSNWWLLLTRGFLDRKMQTSVICAACELWAVSCGGQELNVRWRGWRGSFISPNCPDINYILPCSRHHQQNIWK